MEKGNHFLTGITFLAAAGAVAYTSYQPELNQYLPTIADKAVFAASFVVSTSLPDIDQKIKGIPHRTITHSVWFLIPLILLGLAYNPLFGIFLAALHHIIIDSFSSQGVALLYPFQGYLKYDNGKSVKRGYHIKLYKNREASEYICAILISMVNSAIALMFLLDYFNLYNFF